MPKLLALAVIDTPRHVDFQLSNSLLPVGSGFGARQPVWPENDRYILQAAQETQQVIAAWVVIGGHQNRCAAVLETISGFDLLCLKKTKEGYPNHVLTYYHNAAIKWY